MKKLVWFTALIIFGALVSFVIWQLNEGILQGIAPMWDYLSNSIMNIAGSFN